MAKRYDVVKVTHYDVIDTELPKAAIERIVFNTRSKVEADRVAADHEKHAKRLAKLAEEAQSE